MLVRGRQVMSENRHQTQIGVETTSLLAPLAIGVALILLNAYWIALVSGIHHSLNPAYASLFIAPIANLFFLLIINTLLKRIRPLFALRRAQLPLSLSDVGHPLRGLWT